jgi:tetratricopeptide (TPR) repeat protein
MACVVGLLVYGRHRAELRRLCNEGDALMASTWNAEAGRKLRSALGQTGNPHAPEIAERVIQRLDQYAESWKTTYRAVAEATLLQGQEESGVMLRRLRCLERAREQLDAMSHVLASADAGVVQHAFDAVYALPVPTSCATIEAGHLPTLPGSPDLRARVLGSEQLIAQALAFANAGEVVKAEEVAQRGIAEARAIPYARSEAELLLIDGLSKQNRGDTKGALDAYVHAFGAAQRAADDVLAVRAATRMSSVIGSWMQKPDDAERWMIAAENIADRAGQDDALQAEILTGRMSLNNWLGQSEKNWELLDKVVALPRRLYGERDLRVARALSMRSGTLEMLSQSERAIDDRRASIEIMTELTGADNPAMALDYFNLGACFSNIHRHAEAKTAYERAFKLQSDLPPGSITINIYEGLADANLHVSPPDVTIAIVEEGLKVARALGKSGMREWALRLVRAEALGKKGDVAGKAKECMQVLADQEAHGQVQPTVPYNPDALIRLGEAELELHQTKRAIEHLERSVSLTTRYQTMELAEARFALAKALRVAGREPARARELAESAREELRKAQGTADDVAEIDKWLQQAIQ